MLSMEIRKEACRGCEMCVDVCPTGVVQLDPAEGKAAVARMEDCIACLSCTYLCPSGAIRHHGHHVVKNFYRDRSFRQRMERYL